MDWFPIRGAEFSETYRLVAHPFQLNADLVKSLKSRGFKSDEMKCDGRSGCETHFPPSIAAWMVATSILLIGIIALNARWAMAGSGWVTACIRICGVICQDNPH